MRGSYEARLRRMSAIVKLLPPDLAEAYRRTNGPDKCEALLPRNGRRCTAYTAHLDHAGRAVCGIHGTTERHERCRYACCRAREFLDEHADWEPAVVAWLVKLDPEAQEIAHLLHTPECSLGELRSAVEGALAGS